MFRLTLTLDPDLEDDVVAALADAPLTGLDQFNRDDGLLDLNVWFVDRAAADAAAALFPAVRAQVEEVANQNWNAAWQAQWQPLAVGQRWYLTPPDDISPTPPGRVRLSLKPGLAFGNGDHPTTQLCLAALEQVIRPGDRFLDVGCGSGLLGEAATWLGARSFGCDLSAVDLPVNAFVGSLDALQTASVDVGAMNIQAGIIEQLWPDFTRVVRRHAILSGFLPEQADAVRGLLQAPWQLVSFAEQDGWCALVAIR